jgi:hypothetical protein
MDTAAPVRLSTPAPVSVWAEAAQADATGASVGEPTALHTTSTRPDKVTTECGRLEPCPDRSCGECLLSIYLRQRYRTLPDRESCPNVQNSSLF